MELSEKYYKTLGYYAPSLFFIQLSGKGRLKNMKEWDDIQKATFLHEYIHFLQDITTVQGLQNMYRIGEYLRYVTNVAKDSVKNEIHLPVDPLKTTGYNLKQNWQLSNWTFGERTPVHKYVSYSKQKKGTLVDDLTGNKQDVNGVVLSCLDEKGLNVNVDFGTLQMMEGMAKEVEELAYPSMKGMSPYNPYYIGRDVANSIIKGVGNCGETMIALYDLSLQSSVPGYSFVCYLEDKAKAGYTSTTLTSDVIYDEMLKSQANQAQLGQISFQVAYQFAMNLASGVVKDFTGGHWVYSHIDLWYRQMLSRGRFVRFQYPKIFIDLAHEGDINSNTLFKEVYKLLGTPLIANGAGKYDYRHARKMWFMRKSSMADVYAMVQTQQVFRSKGVYECSLISYCKNKKCGLRTHKVDARCQTQPWARMRRFNRCPFCQWWYYKGFSETKLLYP